MQLYKHWWLAKDARHWIMLRTLHVADLHNFLTSSWCFAKVLLDSARNQRRSLRRWAIQTTSLLSCHDQHVKSRITEITWSSSQFSVDVAFYRTRASAAFGGEANWQGIAIYYDSEHGLKSSYTRVKLKTWASCRITLNQNRWDGTKIIIRIYR